MGEHLKSRTVALAVLAAGIILAITFRWDQQVTLNGTILKTDRFTGNVERCYEVEAKLVCKRLAYTRN